MLPCPDFGPGGSSLLSLPVEGVTIEDIRKVTEDLLKSGTSIDHINAVRKHVSQVKGGQLALAARAKGAEVLSLIISDTVGDIPPISPPDHVPKTSPLMPMLCGI